MTLLCERLHVILSSLISQSLSFAARRLIYLSEFPFLPIVRCPNIHLPVQPAECGPLSCRDAHTYGSPIPSKYFIPVETQLAVILLGAIPVLALLSAPFITFHSPSSGDHQSYQIVARLPLFNTVFLELTLCRFQVLQERICYIFRLSTRSGSFFPRALTRRMSAGAFLEPLVVVLLLFGGAWINRVADFSFPTKKSPWRSYDPFEEENACYPTNGEPANYKKRSLSPSMLASKDSFWRERDIGFLGLQCQVASPNTAVFRNRLLSRLLCKFPFLVECWYWALIYWVSFGCSSHSEVSC